jgi:pyridinium-3,5-biscarboxylic acid mononucleotide sulfurtransferase
MIDAPRYKELVEYLKKLDKVAVAYSGGVDSTFLLVAAHEALGDKAIAISVKTSYMPDWDYDQAVAITTKYKIRHIFVEMAMNELVRNNPVNRCYFCKKNEFGLMIGTLKEEGIIHLLAGENADDIGDYRPGIEALNELQIQNPLMKLGFSKDEIRKLSKALDLPTWNVPASACLLSRIPYGTPITEENINRVHLSEKLLRSLGFQQVRVRAHGDVARIEVDRDHIFELLDQPVNETIVTALKKYGFKYVTIDMAGYRMGSLNEVLDLKHR